VTTRLHWSFPDPAGCEGTQEEKLQATREIRDMIHRQIAEFCNSICQQQAA
jgi:arsenate reductase